MRRIASEGLQATSNSLRINALTCSVIGARLSRYLPQFTFAHRLVLLAGEVAVCRRKPKALAGLADVPDGISAPVPAPGSPANAPPGDSASAACDRDSVRDGD